MKCATSTQSVLTGPTSPTTPLTDWQVNRWSSRLVGLVVKATASRAEDPRFDSRSCHGDFPGLSFSFSCSSTWHRSARKGPYALRPVSWQSPQGCPRNSANICLVEHRSFSTLEGGMSAASFLHSSFLQAINAVMLWFDRVNSNQ